jgi:hypothetical protein
MGCCATRACGASEAHDLGLAVLRGHGLKMASAAASNEVVCYQSTRLVKLRQAYWREVSTSRIAGSALRVGTAMTVSLGCEGSSEAS